jgi:catechol 2,3-dioxygenase-like lactoylglutathione lyase family enzyme
MNGILDHISISVSDYERSKAFYLQALEPLGMGLAMEYGRSAGFGRGRKPELWISGQKASFQSDAQLRVITPVHVALRASSREEVEAFHRAAIAAGARDFGAPGLRPEYHANYFGAFVLDPDGHNLEAVWHGG